MNFMKKSCSILSLRVICLMSHALSPIERKFPNKVDLIRFLRHDIVKVKIGEIVLGPNVVSFNVLKGFQYHVSGCLIMVLGQVWLKSLLYDLVS